MPNVNVDVNVNALENLNPEQREIVREIAQAAFSKNGIRELNYEGIANYVRSQANHASNKARPYPTNNTLKENGGAI
jgi:hypothetical protein